MDQSTIDLARSEGEKAAEAMHVRDSASATFHRNYLARLKLGRTRDEQSKLQSAFDDGYRSVTSSYGDRYRA